MPTTAEPCPNCGDPTSGSYCPSCGQRRSERRITFRRMVSEVIEDQLSMNAALPRTLRALLFHPGLLSTEYINGRIQRYIPPFRLYLASSVVFFLLLSLLPEHGGRLLVRIDAGADSSRTLREAIERVDTAGTAAERQQAMQPFRTGWDRLDSLGNERLRRYYDLPPQQAAQEFNRELLRRMPTAVFLLLPIFALLLQLLFFRRRRYYVEHFVFALHTHAFLFALFTVMLFGARMPVIGPLLLGWLVLYGYLALRRYYGQGWVRTLLKYVVLGACYAVVLLAGMGLTAVAALLLS